MDLRTVERWLAPNLVEALSLAGNDGLLALVWGPRSLSRTPMLRVDLVSIADKSIVWSRVHDVEGWSCSVIPWADGDHAGYYIVDEVRGRLQAVTFVGDPGPEVTFEGEVLVVVDGPVACPVVVVRHEGGLFRVCFCW